MYYRQIVTPNCYGNERLKNVKNLVRKINHHMLLPGTNPEKRRMLGQYDEEATGGGWVVARTQPNVPWEN
jgi:hypothetical protein